MDCIQVAERFYYIAVGTSCFSECTRCELAGCRNIADRTEAEIFRLIERAKLGGFHAVVFSASVIELEFARSIFAHAEKRELRFIIQIHYRALLSRKAKLDAWLKRGTELNILFDGNEEVDFSLLSGVTSEARDFHLTLMPTRDATLLSFFRRLPKELYSRVYFHFSPYSKTLPLLPVREVHETLRALREALPDLEIRPPRGREVWDHRVSQELSLDCDSGPSFEYQAPASGEIVISVVIPSFNAGGVLERVLGHLLLQSLPREQFEIIVIDDGSTDYTLSLLKEALSKEAQTLNFKYFVFPRNRNTRQGELSYRAGAARNLGVKHARGRLLAFLDADIIVPPDYLEKLVHLHQYWDVIQCARYHLKPSAEARLVRYSEIDSARDAYVLEKSYWGPFYTSDQWQTLPHFWQYTCTYGLSLKTCDFKKAGWFRRTFVSYGFEDTDLGYRLAKMGLKFHQSQIATFHLSSSPEAGASELKSFSAKVRRIALLQKTAKIFYLNTLCPDVYSRFYNYLGGEGRVSNWIWSVALRKKKKKSWAETTAQV